MGDEEDIVVETPPALGRDLTEDMSAHLIVVNEEIPDATPFKQPEPAPRIGRRRAEAALRRLFKLPESTALVDCSVRWCVGALTERRAGEPEGEDSPPEGTPLVPRAGEMLSIFARLIDDLGPMSITVELALSMGSLEEVCQYMEGLPDRGRAA